MVREERMYDSPRAEDRHEDVQQEDRTPEEFTEDKSILSEDSFCPLDGYTHPIHR